MATKKQVRTKKAARRVKRPTVGARIIEGLEQAIAWTRGQNGRVRVTLVDVPETDIRGGRRKMG